MADQSFDPDPTVEHEDIDFTFEDGGTDQAGLDDFDFDIGDGSVPFQADAALDVTATEGSNPIGNDEATLPEDAAVLDEIDYEEAGDEPAEPNAEQAVEPTTSLAEDLQGQEVNQDNVDDEINYEEDVEGDLGASAETDEAIQHAGIDTDHTTMDEPGDDLEHTNGIDGAVDPTVRSAAAGFSATGLDILDGTSATGRLGEIADEAKLDDAISRGYFGGIADELSQGLSQLNEPYTSSPPSVTVTWGDEICPLLKTSEDDDPTSFYLDSVEALNLPLSFFLAMIRKNISSWVDDDDEIHIRIDELGLEFAETTTEALLRQVTFAQLVALHNTLLKNDDPDADRGFNIILTTRPNCTFRLKELVQGANSGKGLSAFQPTLKSSVSSSASDADDAASDEVSPAEKEFEEAAQREESYEQDDTGGGQGYSEADSDAEDEEDDVVDYDAQAQDGDDADEHNAEDELDLISYTNDEETEMQNTGAAASNRDSEEAAYTTGFDEQADDLLSYDDETDVAQVRSGGDDGDVHAATGSPAGGPQLDYALTADGHENDDSGDNMAYLELDHGTTPHDDVLSGDHQHGEAEVLDDDEYLDLDGDTGHDYITDKVTVQDTQKPFEANGQSGATSTVHGDEIDYEDHPAGNTNGESAVAGQESLQDLDNGTRDQQGGLDEIDWDDEDKILAPNADASPTISITGKRNREDEADELPDEGHDTKRHRQEQVLF